MNSVLSFDKLIIVLFFLINGNWLFGQIPCGINDVSLSASQQIICDPPAQVDFNATLDLDTAPVFLYALVSTGNFQSPFVHDFPTENNGCLYALRIVGSYSIWSNPMELVDACYRFDPITNQLLNQDDPAGMTIPTPLYVEPNAYNTDHEYWFFYEGNGQEVKIEFRDSGQYSDNEGDMDFEWYAIPCYDTTWNVLGAQLPGQTMRSLSFPNSGTFNISVEVLDNLSGCMDMASTEIKVSEKIETTVDASESCPDSDAGIATATLTGGTNPFQYLWDGGGMDASIADMLSAGPHQLIVTDAIGCMDTVDFVINEKMTPPIEFTSSDPSCPGFPNGNIEVLNPDPTWIFSLDNINFQNDEIFQNLEEGGYRIYVQDTDGCTFSDSTNLFALSDFEVQMATEITIARGSSETLKTEVIGGTPGYTYEWFPTLGLSCTDCANPTASPTETSTYTVNVTDIAGCMVTATITVRVPEPDPNEKRVFLPEAFSPNNDGINDFFTVFSQSGIENVTQFAVFDRWGGLVFQNENFQPNLESEGWDGTWQGKSLDTGVYTWFVEIDWLDGVQTVHEGGVTLFKVD